MIFTTERTKIVYLGKKNDDVLYVGRGNAARAISLVEQRGYHHVADDFDEVEILGPYTIDESIDIEKSLIQQHLPKHNDYHNPTKRVVHEKVRKRTVHEKIHVKRGRPHGYTDKTRMIMDDLSEGVMTQAEIARKHGVSRQHVNGIKKNFRKVHMAG